MVDTGIFATTAEVQRVAGVNVNTTYSGEAYVNQYMTMAESEINAVTRFNWSDAYSGLNADVKGLLKAAACAYCGILIVQADMDQLPSLREAEDRINVLRDLFLRNVSLLRDKKTRVFLSGA